MRMRKKKWAEPYLSEHEDFTLAHPEEYKGKWKELFHTSILHVELGMGKGGYIRQMSSMYPEEGWIGIEKDVSAAAVSTRKILEEENRSIDNVRMIRGLAENMEEWFEEGEIDVIHLNFSDPWPKSGTHKRRLSSANFLTIYKKLLSIDGIIRMKTDNKGLFEDSVLYFLQNGFDLKEFSVDYRRNDHSEDAITEYESKFMEEGQPIYQLAAVKKKEM